MAIERMSLVNIFGKRSQLDRVVLKCSDCNGFHPEQASGHSESIEGFLPLNEENPYASLLRRISDLAQTSGINLDHLQTNRSTAQLKESLRLLNEGRIKTSALRDSSPPPSDHPMTEYLHRFGYDLDLLIDCKELSIGFGYIPTRNQQKLASIQHNDYLLIKLMQEKRRTFLLYITPKSMEQSTESRLETIGFQKHGIPEFLHRAGDSDKILGQNTEVDGFIEVFRDELISLSNTQHTIQNAINSFEAALTHINHMDALDFNLDELFSCKFLKVRFGRIPADNFNKLDYYKDKMFFYISLDSDKDYNWGLYITAKEFAAEVDEIFSSLYFERLWIPEYVHGTPDFAKVHLQTELKAQYEAQAYLEKRIQQLVTANSTKFAQIYFRLKFLSDTFDMRKYVTVQGETFHIEGFILEKLADTFVKGFESVPDISVEIAPVDNDKRLVPPTKLKNNFMFRPFEMFVEMYGLPGYNDMDPTPFVAITYMLLFGIMFGDAGQGLVISLVGLFLSKVKKMPLGGIMVRIGITSTLFGMIYGSVFGFEELLNPFYIGVLGLSGKPIHVMDPSATNLILGTAVGLGVVLLTCTMVLNITLSLRKKDYGRALLSNSGVAGLVFYLGVVAMAVNKLMLGGAAFNNSFITPLLVISFFLMFFKEPIAHKMEGHASSPFEHGLGAFFTEAFFEMFEIVLSFVTNTMSFLRVGGFALAHAGMMAVVFNLAGSVPPLFSPLVIIIGNVFVMCMEGLIVGIQVLRLEFYELFSHYFDGNGKPFAPIYSKQ